MSLGNAFPVRSTVPDLTVVTGLWTGGGAAADMSVTSGDWNKGIASVAYNAATGKYLITFVDVGADIVHCEAKVHRPTSGDDPIGSNILIGTFSRTAKTVEVEFGATLVDIDTDEKVSFFFLFAKNSP